MAWRLAVALMACVGGELGAQASSYLPLRDPAYADLDALIVAGAIRTAVARELPRSRIAFARLILEARAGRATARGWSENETRALLRLEGEFTSELDRLSAASISQPQRRRTPRRVRADLTVAESPDRVMLTPSGRQGPSQIDADFNPLLQRNEGRTIANGETLAIEGQWEGSSGQHLAYVIRPRAWVSAGRGPGAGSGITAHEAYLRFVGGNLAVDAGRLHPVLGYGREAGPMLGFNARGIEMLRFSMDSPARMPGLLRIFGPVLASASIGHMGANSDTPHSRLVVFNGTARPVSFFELGMSLLNHWGGSGSPPTTLKDRLLDIFLLKKSIDDFEIQISDKVGELAGRLLWPQARSQMYVHVAFTDDRHWFERYDAALTADASWTVGWAVNGIGGGRAFDAWLEGRRSGVRPQSHHQYTSGLTVDRRTIGEMMGPLSQGLSAGVTRRTTGGTFDLSLAAEQYGGGDVYGSGYIPRVIVDEPDEIRWRLEGAWTAAAATGQWVPLIRAGVEHVSYFDFRPGTRLNGMLQLGLQYGR